MKSPVALILSSFANLLIVASSCATSSSYSCPISKKQLTHFNREVAKGHVGNIPLRYEMSVYPKLTSEDSITVSGMITDPISGQPVSAAVSVVGSEIGVTAYNAGYFKLKLPMRPFQLQFIAVGNGSFVTNNIEPLGDTHMGVCLGTSRVN